MAYIRISEDNKIVEVSPVPDNEDIFNYYVSGIAERFIKVDLPEGVKIGWTYENGVFIEPPPLLGVLAPLVPPPPPTESQIPQ